MSLPSLVPNSRDLANCDPVPRSRTGAYHDPCDYGLNIGGAQISGCNDTGMFRSWDPDNNYIYEPGSTQVYDNPIRYTMDTPNYTAPELVYQTQRSMGKRANKYNLTWILPVDWILLHASAPFLQHYTTMNRNWSGCFYNLHY
ncbi:putative non-specific serine/threonine protein kinase [Helianthus anomalus]